MTDLQTIHGGTEAEAIAELAVPRVIAQSLADWAGDQSLPDDVLVAVGEHPTAGPMATVYDMESYGLHPRRKRSVVELYTIDSFLKVCSTHFVDDVSNIYVDSQDRSLTAVFDDHGGPGKVAGWQDHLAKYQPRFTAEWLAWLKLHNNGYVSQDYLAEFLGQWRATIVEPDDADVYEMAQAFEATVKASFSSGGRLSNGARQLNYAEEVAAQSGSLEIPESLTLSVRLLDDRYAEHIPVEADLRFKIRDGNVKFRVVLENPERLYADYFDGVVDMLTERNYDPLFGSL